MKFSNTRVSLGICNAAFLICSVGILLIGFFLMYDSQRILLSRLLVAPDIEIPQPPYYYTALIFIGMGIYMVATCALGFWASYARGYCVLTMYFLMVIITLGLQCAACVILIVWPGCIGLGEVKGGAVGALQAGYGVPGSEQFTAAMDLAQTLFECCGMTDGRNYEMSLWLLRRLGPRDLIVPLSCCVQNEDSISYLNPKPINESACQELLPQDYIPYRHSEGCLSKVEVWYQQQYIGFLIGLVIMSLIEFGVLLITVISCMKHRKKKIDSFTIKRLNNKMQDNIYHNKVYSSHKSLTTDAYIRPDSFYSPQSRLASNYNKDEMA